MLSEVSPRELPTRGMVMGGHCRCPRGAPARVGAIRTRNRAPGTLWPHTALAGLVLAPTERWFEPQQAAPAPSHWGPSGTRRARHCSLGLCKERAQ